MTRYVNKGMFVSEFQSREEAETDKAYVTSETVRILNAEEEKEIENNIISLKGNIEKLSKKLKYTQELLENTIKNKKEFAWKWYQKRTLMIREKCKIHPLPIDDHLREEFEQLWKENKDG
jgi:hypothetical protein